LLLLVALADIRNIRSDYGCAGPNRTITGDYENFYTFDFNDVLSSFSCTAP
jgi:hypothetical protein